MNHNRFGEIKVMVPLMMEDGNNDEYAWWKVRGMLNKFNKTREDLLLVSKIHVLDKSMSDFWPR